MNLVIVPFHDWKKSEKEGHRTRDAHIINALHSLDNTDKILIINRPTTRAEFLIKNYRNNFCGKKLLEKDKFTLYEIADNKYVTTYRSTDVFGQLFLRHLWFIKKYADDSYIQFIKECLELLNVLEYDLIIQNIFAYKIESKLLSRKTIFDAWDNFLRFPSYRKYNDRLREAYTSLAISVKIWLTNSEENKTFFKNKFGVRNLKVLKNGVKENFLHKSPILPESMKNLPRPIVGFGGKISYLLNVEIINYITAKHPNYSFVFVGQILDKEVFNNIIKRNNVSFLGDIHYDDYPNYVDSFDACIIPYNTGNDAHGGDSIKAYEFMLTGKKIIGTNGNGLESHKNYIYLAETKEEFSEQLLDLENNLQKMDIRDISWESRAKNILNFLGYEVH